MVLGASNIWRLVSRKDAVFPRRTEHGCRRSCPPRWALCYLKTPGPDPDQGLPTVQPTALVGGFGLRFSGTFCLPQVSLKKTLKMK